MKNHIALYVVDSSQIHAIGHDPATNTLALQFKRTNPETKERVGGTIYHYANVPANVASDMLEADSVGKFFGAHIKDKRDDKGELLFPFTKIVEDDNDQAQ